MNEELKSQALSVLSTIIADAVKLKEFVVDQAPDVVQQLLVWHFYKSLLLVLLFGTLFFVSISVTRMLWKKSKWDHGGNPDNNYAALMGFGTFCSVVLGVLTIVCFFTNLAWLQIWIAPKVFLIEYAAGLVK